MPAQRRTSWNCVRLSGPMAKCTGAPRSTKSCGLHNSAPEVSRPVSMYRTLKWAPNGRSVESANANASCTVLGNLSQAPLLSPQAISPSVEGQEYGDSDSVQRPGWGLGTGDGDGVGPMNLTGRN